MEDLDYYLERIGESAKRSRVVFYLLLISTALSFAYQWQNLYEFNWLQSRVERRQAMLNCWEKLEANCKQSESTEGVSTYCKAPGDLSMHCRALEWLKLDAKDPESRKILEWQLRALLGERYGRQKFPLLDITFDVNDYRLFSTLELLILAVAFGHCLMREKDNLRILFEGPQEQPLDQLKEVYQKATMQQVWTVPLEPDNEKKVRWLRRGFCLLYFLPVLVNWGFVVYGWVREKERFVPSALNMGLGITELCLEVFSLLLLTVTMLWAYRSLKGINEIWDRAYDSAHSSANPSASPPLDPAK